MSKSNKFFGAALFVVLALAAGTYFIMANSSSSIAADSDEAKVAVVNGAVITKANVKEAASSLPIAAQVPPEQLYPMVADQLINDTLLAQKVETTGLETDPEVQKRLDKMRDQIVRNLYVERYISEHVTDERVRAEYEKLKAEHEGVKEVHARHILVDDKAKAEQLIAELEEGADFAELAKEHSTGPTGPKGGDLGYFGEGEMVPEFSEVAFATKEGTYAKEPVQTQFGWHVIYVEDVRERPVPSYEEVEAGVRNQLHQQAINSLIEDLRSNASVKRYDWESGEEIPG